MVDICIQRENEGIFAIFGYFKQHCFKDFPRIFFQNLILDPFWKDPILYDFGPYFDLFHFGYLGIFVDLFSPVKIVVAAIVKICNNCFQRFFINTDNIKLFKKSLWLFLPKSSKFHDFFIDRSGYFLSYFRFSAFLDWWEQLCAIIMINAALSMPFI